MTYFMRGNKVENIRKDTSLSNPNFIPNEEELVLEAEIIDTVS